jgi:hypothetical protein
MSKARIAILAALAVLVAPAIAQADTTVAADPAAQDVDALDGSVVWVSGRFGSQRLMQKTDAGVAPVAGAPVAAAYRSIDLGRDGRGGLVLTYLRCRTASSCVARQDDLRGGRRSLRGLTRPGCSLSTAPALWRTRAAYGLACRRGRTFDPRRTGLYVKTAGGAPRRLPLPAAAVRAGADELTAVELRGTRVGAVAADIYEYAFSQTVTGGDRRSFLAAASEGDSDAHARGVSLGTGGALWTLVDAEHVGDPNQAVIFRQAGSCLEYETLENAAGPDQETGFRATALAVDGDELYLVVPGTGIVTHAFAPVRPCSPPDGA